MIKYAILKKDFVDRIKIIHFISQNTYGKFLHMKSKYHYFVHKFICTDTLEKGT